MRTALSAALLAGTSYASLNSDFSRSFWGIAYSSNGVILPNCGATQSDVTTDIINLAQLTPRVRLYGSDCNQTALVMQGIADSNADLTVWPCIFIPVPYNQTVVDRQWGAVSDAFRTYGVDKIGGLTVGNEFLLDSYGSSGTPTDSAGVAARTQLLETISTINKSLIALNLGKNIPVGTSDAGSAVTTALLEGVDYFMANDHPWFGNLPIDQAAGWTWLFLQDNDVAVGAKTKNQPTIYIGETGWPTASDNASDATNGASAASVANLQTFIDDWVCPANTNITNGGYGNSGYFFFEYQDMEWQKIYGGVEAHWGILDSSKNLKSGLKLPTCLVVSPTGGTVSQLQTNATANSTSPSGSTTDAASSSGATKLVFSVASFALFIFSIFGHFI